MLEIYAGSNALKTIQEHGFKQELFSNFLGASGDPKWLGLAPPEGVPLIAILMMLQNVCFRATERFMIKMRKPFSMD